MGASSSKYNEDISIKGDLNIYIFGRINYKSGQKEDVMNYNALKMIFDIFENNGNIQSKNHLDKIYPYEYRKLDKKLEINGIKERKIYNAFLFFNEVDEIFSKILIEEHICEMDKKNENKNIIIYFGKDDFIKDSFDKINENSPETLPFLIIVKNIAYYSEKLKIVNYIPNISSIRNILMSPQQKRSKEETNSTTEKILLYYIKTKIYRIDMYYNELGFNLNMLNPFNEINSKIKVNLTIALLGCSGSGKSTLINLLFNEFVCKAISSGADITTKCSEYYLPININADNVGQIRFLDFPGINEEKNYSEVIEPQLIKKIEEYKNNREQIDLALFYISNGNERVLKDTSLKLINLLHSNKIKIIFIINGKIEQNVFNNRKKNLKNQIKNNEILKDDFNNIIHTDYFQYYGNQKSKTGISLIIEKIIDIIKIKDKNFKVGDITVDNYNQKLLELKKLTRLFELYEDMTDLKDSIRLKSKWVVAGFSALAFGTSALSLLVPLVDTATAIGYQVAMVYSIFSLYQLDTREYKITNIILSGGDSIELEDVYKPKNNNDNNNNGDNKKDELMNKYIKEGFIKVAQNIPNIMGQMAAKEAGKEVAEKVVKKMVINKCFGAMIVANQGKNVVLYGQRETIKTITESIIIKQGGKSWFVNLGKAVPLIGAAISAIVNTASTAVMGHKLVTKLDEEFENNRQRQVDVIKGKILGIYNIIDQLKFLIENNKN